MKDIQTVNSPQPPKQQRPQTAESPVYQPSGTRIFTITMNVSRQQLPVGMDMIVATYAYHPQYHIDRRIWKQVNRSRWRLLNIDRKRWRNIKLFATKDKVGSMHFELCFSPNRVRHKHNIFPAFPSDSDFILDFVQNFLDCYSWLADFAPIRSILWSVSRVDFNVDFMMPDSAFCIVANTFADIGFKYSSCLRKYHFGEEIEPEDEYLFGYDPANPEVLIPLTDPYVTVNGAFCRNRGKRMRCSHVLYYKQEELTRFEQALAYQCPPDFRRDEVRVKGRECLAEIGLDRFTVEAALRYSNRTRVFKWLLKKHGIEQLPDDFHLPLHCCVSSMKWKSTRERFLAVDEHNRTLIQLVLMGLFDNALELAEKTGKNYENANYFKDKRREWKKLGLYRFQPDENEFFLRYIETFLTAEDGCFVSMPDWRKYFQCGEDYMIGVDHADARKYQERIDKIIAPQLEKLRRDASLPYTMTSVWPTTITDSERLFSLSKPLFEMNLDRITPSPHRSENRKGKVTPSEYSQRAPP